MTYYPLLAIIHLIDTPAFLALANTHRNSL
jgi:hypothetical protein